jgi:hypothetical protein
MRVAEPAPTSSTNAAADVPVVQVSSPTSPQDVRASGGPRSGGQGWSFDAAGPSEEPASASSNAHATGGKNAGSVGAGEEGTGSASRQATVEDVLDEEDVD